MTAAAKGASASVIALEGTEPPAQIAAQIAAGAVVAPGAAPAFAADCPVPPGAVFAEPGLPVVAVPAGTLTIRAAALAARLGLCAGTRVQLPPVRDAASLVAALACAAAGAQPVQAGASVVLLPNAPFDATPQVVFAMAGRGLARRMRAAWPGARLVNGWGNALSAGPCLLSDPLDPPLSTIATRGRPLPRVEVMVVDPASGRDLGLYEPGQVMLRGPDMFASVLSGETPRDAAGFIATGQRGWLDCEGRVALAGE